MAAVMVHPDLPRQPILVLDEDAVPLHELSGWVELDQNVFPTDEPEVDLGVPSAEDDTSEVVEFQPPDQPQPDQPDQPESDL